jgi:quercetin 2,3-dioxygenase
VSIIKSADKEVKFLQIWVFPNKKNVTPRYDQITLKSNDRHNTFQQILSPNADDAGVWVHQNAWFHLAQFDANHTQVYKMKDKTNGLYVFNLKGDIKVDNQALNTRDGYGIWNVDEVTIKADSAAEFLLMEVPMNV